jgi:tetratricopeptide (TPR) repeat protein
MIHLLANLFRNDMKRGRRYLLLLSLSVILQACTSATRPVSAPVPVEDRSVKNEQDNVEGYPSDRDRDMQAGSSNLPGTKNGRRQNTESQPMVVALLEDAEDRIKSGDHASAAATLERALRLEPKNAMLWYRLGLIRLKQKNWQQAINLAKKSNSLSAGDYALQSDNWKLIANANSGAGNIKAARLATERANKIEKRR